MAGLYLDTSALGRILLAEPDAAAIRQTLADYDAWWSSALLIVELRRLAARENLEAMAERLLSGVRTEGVGELEINRLALARLQVHRRSRARLARCPDRARRESSRPRHARQRAVARHRGSDRAPARLA